jgi:hypothetical protein
VTSDVGNYIVRSWLAGAAVLCAWIVGILCGPAAHADGWDVGVDDVAASAVLPIITSYPLELLSDASTNLMDANQVLTAGSTDIPGLILQPDIQDHALNIVTSLSNAETSLSSYDNGAFADLLNPWFNSVDQGLYQGTEALLDADKAVEAAITADSGVNEAVLGVLESDLQLGGDLFNALPIEFVDGFIDPSIFANIF